MPAIVVILIILGAGLFIGSRFEHARTAHQHFSSYRTRTIEGLGTWLKSTITAVTGIAALIFVLYLLLFQFHVR